MPRTSISTTIYSEAYLTVAWKARGQLQDYERRGFGQFVYLTVCAHLESVIAELIQRRLLSIRHMLNWEAVPPKRYKKEDQLHHCDLKPIVDSLMRILTKVDKDSHVPLK